MIKAHVKTTEKVSGGYKKFAQQAKFLRGAYVTIGIHEDAGAYPDGTSVVQVALWDEFGTETSPERSFFRSTLDRKEGQINQWREEMIKKIVDGEMTVEKALETLGFRIREMIKNTIQSNVPPPNAPSTLDHKKREGVAPRTLMESTLLLRSVEYKVVLK
jgi:hypothetical protein